MPGILEQLQQRKDALRSLRENNLEDYGARLTGAFNRVVSAFGSKQARVAASQASSSEKVARELSQQGAQSQQNQRLNQAHDQQQASLAKSQVEATRTLTDSTELGNRKITGALGEVVQELKRGFKDLKQAVVYGNSGSLLDLLGPKRGTAPGKVLGKVGGVVAEGALEGSAASSGVLGRVGSFLGRNAGPIAALGLGVYDAYNVLSDDTRSTEDKTHAVTNIAGGTAGALGGAAAGAAIGSVIPVVGTAVGGLVGGALGYMGGTALTDKAQDYAKDFGTWLADSDVGSALGMAAAVAMSPFSEDARDSLSSTYKNTILPAMSSTFAPVIGAISNFGESVGQALSDFWKGTKDTASILTEAGSQVLSGARNAAQAVWGGVKAAASQAVQGNFSGAGQALRSAGSQAYGEIKGGAQVAAGLARGRYTSEEAAAIANLSAQGEKFRGGKGLTADTKSMITEVAQSQGIDPKTMLTMAQIESGGNPNAVSATGAAGLYQFTGRTAKQYGIKNRFDPRENAEAAAKFMADNAATLKKYGIEPTAENLYLAHQQGAAGAAEILRAASGKGTLSAETAENMRLNYGNMSPQEYVELNKKKVAAAAAQVEATTYAGTYTGIKAQPTTETSVALTGTDARAKPIAAAEAKPTAKVATPAPAGSTSTTQRVAEAKVQPVQKVAPQAPPEVTPVAVTNPPPPPPPAKDTAVKVASAPNSIVPDLSEIPPFFPDLALASIMLGRV